MIKEAAEKNVYDSYDATQGVHSYTISDIMSKKPPYLDIIVLNSVTFLQDIYKLGKLDLRFGGKMFLGGQARLLAQLHEEGDEIGETLDRILKFIKWLKEEYEQDIKSNAENYLSLSDITGTLKEYHKLTKEYKDSNYVAKGDDKVSKSFIKKVETLENDFKKLKEAKKVINKNII